MISLNGVGISEGIAFGKIFVKNSGISDVQLRETNDTELELNRYKMAKQATLDYTRKIYEKVFKTVGKEEAEIFKSHEMMICDREFENSIIKIIQHDKLSAEYAVSETSKKFSKFFSEMPDPYMKSRAIDIKDISKCMINYLLGKSEADFLKNYDGNVILAANDFTPSEVSLADKSNINGFLCLEGSAYSHSSILMRVMKIPGIISLKDKLGKDLQGKYVILDGSTGEIYIDPEKMMLNLFRSKKLHQEKSRKLLKTLKGKKNVTLDGQEIKIQANMNNPTELDEILESDSDGVGLLRSEFIYLGEKDFPSEEKQFKIYKSIVEKFGEKGVTIRTLDIGSDKKADYFNLPFEHNPAMGYRGIRLCLDKPEIFKTQLRAIYRASAYGNISVMFPMISSIDEVKEVKKYIEEVESELRSENIEFSKNIKKGIMIETPAAVMMSDELAKEVDFFSIGTNDLTQYTLAVDRQNGKVGSLFDTRNKAVLRMIMMAVKNAHKNGIPVGICGESASDESLLETYLAMGVDKLSMSAPFVLKIRKKVRETNVSDIKGKVLKNL